MLTEKEMEQILVHYHKAVEKPFICSLIWIGIDKNKYIEADQLTHVDGWHKKLNCFILKHHGGIVCQYLGVTYFMIPIIAVESECCELLRNTGKLSEIEQLRKHAMSQSIKQLCAKVINMCGGYSDSRM